MCRLLVLPEANIPMSGVFKMNLSKIARPRLVLRDALKPTTRPVILPTIRNAWATNALEMLMTICVGLGSAPPPKSLNMFSKTGMTFQSSTITTRMATARIEMG